VTKRRPLKTVVPITAFRNLLSLILSFMFALTLQRIFGK